jgi:hypothetical protein
LISVETFEFERATDNNSIDELKFVNEFEVLLATIVKFSFKNEFSDSLTELFFGKEFVMISFLKMFVSFKFAID